MKNYTITVNGNVYDVTVEENGSVSAPVAAPRPNPSPKQITPTSLPPAQLPRPALSAVRPKALSWIINPPLQLSKTK